MFKGKRLRDKQADIILDRTEIDAAQTSYLTSFPSQPSCVLSSEICPSDEDDTPFVTLAVRQLNRFLPGVPHATLHGAFPLTPAADEPSLRVRAQVPPLLEIFSCGLPHRCWLECLTLHLCCSRLQDLADWRRQSFVLIIRRRGLVPTLG